MYSKRALVICLPLLFASSALAQSSASFVVEGNFARYADEPGMFYDRYDERWLFFNGLRIGYTFSDSSTFIIGFRRSSGATGNEGTKANIKGIEINGGWEKTIAITSKISMMGEVGIFYDYATIRGIIHTDCPPDYEINHIRKFFGFYPEFKIGYWITNDIMIMASTRLRVGRLDAASIESLKPELVLLQTSPEIEGNVEGLSNLGLRVRL